jgi:membrane protease YdiL (CAAX protease family)
VAQPLAFSVVVALVTVGLLYVARQSQDLLESGDDRTIELPDSGSPNRAVRDETEQGNTPVEPVTQADTDSPMAGTPFEEHTPETAASTTETPSEPTDLSPAKSPAPDRPGSRSREVELTPRMVIGNVAVTQGLIAAIVLAAGWYFAIPAEAFGVTADQLSTGLPAVGVGAGFGVLLWVGNESATTIADAVGAAYDEGVRGLLAPESPGGWLLLFGGVLPIIAISEELLFRAALIGVPAANFPVSPWLLAAMSSLAFALGHGAQGRVGVVVTGVLGFVLAAGYILSGSLLIVVVAHYVINALEFLIHEYFALDVGTTVRPR